MDKLSRRDGACSMKVRAHFRFIYMPCCGQLLCWVNPATSAMVSYLRSVQDIGASIQAALQRASTAFLLPSDQARVAVSLRRTERTPRSVHWALSLGFLSILGFWQPS